MVGGEAGEDAIRRYGDFDVTRFTDLELRLYSLINAGKATMWEMKNVYTLDEALKLDALHQMNADIETAKIEEAKADADRRR